MKKTETDIQIRFADIDMLGHVNNVNLQHYFDLGKSAFYRDALSVEAVPGMDIYPIVASTQNSYLAQTRHNERIYVETSMPRIGNKSMTLLQRIISRDTGEIKAESHSVMVAFDFTGQVSVPVPDAWRRANGDR